jgi:hypothetical protein
MGASKDFFHRKYIDRRKWGNFSVEEGEFVVFLSKWSRQTTTLKMLSGFVYPLQRRCPFWDYPWG